MLYNTIYPETHPYGHQNRGDVSSLESLTVDDVRAFERRLGMSDTHIVERAFELAQSGECRNVEAIKRRLKAENYLDTHTQLAGPAIRRQLAELCDTAAKNRQT